MALSSNFSILSDDVVVVGGASDVEVSLAVVVWNGNGSGWTLVVSSFLRGDLLAFEVGRMVVVVLVGGVVVELLLCVDWVDVMRIGSITNFSLSAKPPSSSATISTSSPKSTNGCMIPGPVLPFSGGPRGSPVCTSSTASLLELNSTRITSLEGSS